MVVRRDGVLSCSTQKHQHLVLRSFPFHFARKVYGIREARGLAETGHTVMHFRRDENGTLYTLMHEGDNFGFH